MPRHQARAPPVRFLFSKIYFCSDVLEGGKSDGDPDIEAEFTILRKTSCASVLSENGFQDCEESLRFLESEEGKEAIIGLHVDGILDYVNPDREYGYNDLKYHFR